MVKALQMRGCKVALGVAAALLACGGANRDAARSQANMGGGAGMLPGGGATAGTNPGTAGSGRGGTAGSGAGSGSGGLGGSGPSTGGAGAGKGGAGGAAARGGSGPAAGAGGDMRPPHVVGKCDGLGAVDQWEEISPPGMVKEPPYTGALVALVDTNTAGTVYVTTSRSGIFKSTDCGASWVKTNTGRNGDQLDAGLIWSAALDPVSPDTLYALAGYGPAGLWKSTNGGVDWDNVLPADRGMPGSLARVTMDPTDHLHLLVGFHDNCTAGHTPVCFGETKDGGATWTVLDFPTQLKDGWAEGTSILPIDATRWLYEAWELYYTPDAGTTWREVDTGGAASVAGPYFKAPDGAMYLATANGVLTSADGENWTRIPDSGGGMDGIVGCADRLFSVVGFGPPSGPEFIYTATYANPMQWSVLATPGLPSSLSSGANSIACDVDHQVVYTAIQGEGLWRMRAGRGTGGSSPN
jgi:hypothetical protein